MTFGMGSLLLADSSPVSAAGATRYEFTQWSAFSEWWQVPLLVLACLAVVAFVAWMYRRDSVELRPGVGVFLAVMRLAAFVGLLLFYLGLEKWAEQKEVQNSRRSCWSIRASAWGWATRTAPARHQPIRGLPRSSTSWPPVRCSAICGRHTTWRSGDLIRTSAERPRC